MDALSAPLHRRKAPPPMTLLTKAGYPEDRDPYVFRVRHNLRQEVGKISSVSRNKGVTQVKVPRAGKEPIRLRGDPAQPARTAFILAQSSFGEASAGPDDVLGQ